MPKDDESNFFQMLSNKPPGQGTIKDANQRLIALLDAAVDALVVIDGKGNIEIFNSAAQKMFGYSKREVFGKNIKMLMPDTFSIEHDKYLASYLTSGEEKIDKGRKVKGKKSNGEEFPIFLSVGEVKNSSDIQFVGIIRDISEQEQDRIDARESRERLSHASRLSSMGELAAGIAHEMNQPLSAISSYAQASKRLLQSDTQDNKLKVVAALDKICDQAIRASEVIHRLRTFVKKRVAQRESVDLNALIYETVNLAKVDTRILDHEVLLKLCHNKKPILIADPIQIQQVLLNLIRNGIDAMEHHKGAPLLIHSQWLSNIKIEVSVIDFGLGIDQKTSSGIFNPFFTTKETGMGMGLSVSQTIIHAHGGNIYFSPSNNSGCTFSFSLPATFIRQEDMEK